MNVCDITSAIELDTLKHHILQTSTVAWNQRISKTNLEKWLNNFTGEALGEKAAEQAIAAWLLMNFTYYTNEEVRELCRLLFRKYIHKKLQEEYYLQSTDNRPEKIQRILKRTIFIPLGNPSESGAVISFNFRTANGLPKELFDQPDDLKEKIADGLIDDVVLIDDVTLSGSQAVKYISGLNLDKIQTTLMTFFATPKALEKINKRAAYITPMYVNCLDSRTKLFDENSFVFSNSDCSQLRDYAFQMCDYYGKKIVNNELPPSERYMKIFPLGFSDGQQMFGFYYNTPNNTLPIFWCDSPNWCPAFPRYVKVSGVEGVDIQDEQYW